MRERARRYPFRQVMVLAAALFQVFAGFVLAPGGSFEQDPSLIQPAVYAFFVWGPIFLLSVVYGVYQLLPANRQNPLLKRIGWFTAAAYLFNGLLIWSGGQISGQVLVVLMLTSLAIAFFFLTRRGAVSKAGERWLVALPVSLFFGWITAATVVGASQTFILLGLPAGGAAEALFGAGLLLLGALFASSVILVGRRGAPQTYVTYAVTVLWALVAVAANQLFDSPVTGVVAVLSAVPVAVSLFRASRSRIKWIHTTRSRAPRVARS